MLSTNNGVSVTSVGVAMFTFGLTVFTVSYADFWCMEEKGSCGVIC
ncbi:hypothetical protein IOC51_23810 [Vibrio parahaemolyticus]|nr:hypothetical protein [Vibrio parahaemolyticus]